MVGVDESRMMIFVYYSAASNYILQWKEGNSHTNSIFFGSYSEWIKVMTWKIINSLASKNTVITTSTLLEWQKLSALFDDNYTPIIKKLALFDFQVTTQNYWNLVNMYVKQDTQRALYLLGWLSQIQQKSRELHITERASLIPRFWRE